MMQRLLGGIVLFGIICVIILTLLGAYPWLWIGVALLLGWIVKSKIDDIMLEHNTKEYAKNYVPPPHNGDEVDNK